MNFPTKIVLACDHAGYSLKKHLLTYLKNQKNIQVEDLGCHSEQRVDYPDFAVRVASKVSVGEASYGVLVCGTGQGMAMAANKIKGIRAAVVSDLFSAKMVREHNDSNILCLGSRVISNDLAAKILKVFIETPFEGGRHQERVNKIKEIKNQNFLLQQFDPEIYHSIQKEIDRQEYHLEMIASENFVSKPVLEALGSVLTNKYAEGYPHKRYYGGCDYVDIAEDLAIERAKKLFGAEHVNVQPHSGSQANMAVYLAVCNPGDTIMGQNLSEGGHLTHGSPVNFSGQLFHVVPYGLNPQTGILDYDQIRELAKKHRPKLIVCGASAYPRKIDFSIFREIADEVGAKILADIAHPAGLVATGLHPDPVPYCEFVTTTTHKTLRGPRGGMIMCRQEFATDVNKKIFPGIQGGPLMHVIAAKAVAFKEDLEPSFKIYCQQIIKNTQVLAEVFLRHEYSLVTGGTDNHLILVDLTNKGISGKQAEAALGLAGITVNKNTVPNETRSPFVTSGVRIGTPALTTKGMKEEEMKLIGQWMVDVLDHVNDEARIQKVKSQVEELARRFPLYRR